MWLTPAPVSKKDPQIQCPRGKNGRSGERAGGRHARTGCGTCKIRHVKCDEENPACYQCRKTGRVCDGYDSAKPSATKQATLAPRDLQISNLQISNLTITRIGQELSGSNQERRCFKFFEREIGRDMKHAFNTTHTHQLILQAGHSNDAIKHAIVALGSLGEHLIEKKVLFMQAPRGDERLDFGRLQYMRAIRQLQECISSPENQSLELILACCFLLAIFDFLCGDDSMAQVHLRAGLNILDRCYSKAVQNQFLCPTTDFDKPNSLVHDLFRIFSIMDLHEAIWLGNSSLHPRPLISPQVLTTTPPRINTLYPTLDDISTQLNHHLVRTNILRHSVIINESSLNPFIAPFDILVEKHRLLQGLHEWPSMVEQFLSLRARPAPETTILRISLMKMTYHSTLLSLSTFLQTPNSPHSGDKATVKSAALTITSLSPTPLPPTTSFEEILSLARQILHPVSLANRAALLQAVAANAGEPWPAWSASSSSSGGTIPLFAFVSGAIQPLYLVATQCQDLSMCETAISMLEEAPWREGAWDGAVMARIARRRLRERVAMR